MQIESLYETKYNNVLNQINEENRLAEERRQFNAQLAASKRSSSGGGSASLDDTSKENSDSQDDGIKVIRNNGGDDNIIVIRTGNSWVSLQGTEKFIKKQAKKYNVDLSNYI